MNAAAPAAAAPSPDGSPPTEAALLAHWAQQLLRPEAGIAPAEVAPALQRYLDLLARWNSAYNLTAIRERDAMLRQHIADCLAVVEPVRRRLQASTSGLDPASARVLDVGSGGGLPGLVLALCLPQVQVTCLDTVAKKVAFIRQAAAELRLGNVQAVHARIESWRAPPFDLITARAFASLADFTTLSRHLLKPQGAWMAMKGKLPVDEIAALPHGVEMFHVEPIEVPDLDAQRCLVWLRPRPDSPTQKAET